MCPLTSGPSRRGAGRLPPVHPGREDELDERERQQHQDERRAGDQHQHGEEAPGVGGEGDVAEPQRRHRGEGPVDTGGPAVLAPFVGHQGVEDRAVDGDEDYEQGDEPHDDPGVVAAHAAGEGRQDQRQRLHAPPPTRPGTAAVTPHGRSIMAAAGPVAGVRRTPPSGPAVSVRRRRFAAGSRRAASATPLPPPAIRRARSPVPPPRPGR